MNKTKLLLIDITFDLLYKRGYCATGLMDILKEANLTKGAMYYHFTNKNELVLATMQHYIGYMLNSHWIEPLDEADKPVEKLVTQINALYALYASKDAFLDVKHGCPLNNFINDMSNKEEEFFRYLQDIYAQWQESIEKALTKAQILKQTKKDFNPKEQALFIMSSIEGSITSAKAYNNLPSLKISFDILNKYIQEL